MKILIVRVSAIGDVIHTLPCVFLIKAMIPHAQISWIVQRKAAALIHNQPFLDHVWTLPNKFLSPRMLPQTWSILKEVRSQQWDAIIDFQGLLKTSVLISLLSGTKFGFDRSHARWGGSSLFTHHHTEPHYVNIIQKNLALTADAIQHLAPHTSCPTIHELAQKFFLQIPQKLQESVDCWLALNNITQPIIMCPNTTGTAKHWPLERWQELCLMLTQDRTITTHYSILLVGKQFGNAAQALATWIKHKHLPIICVPAWDLLTTAHLIKQSALIIAPDTGLLHCADFLGTPSLGIFGPTLATRHGPFLQPANQRNAIQIACPHMYQKRHAATKWAQVEQNCMLTLEAATVHKKIVNILNCPK